MSKRILGLDLGTNSIGWAVVDDCGGGEFELIKRGVHIFQEGVKIEKGNESSKAAERTGYRSARRLKFRRKLRKIETLKALSEAGFCPELSVDELKAWQSKKIYPESPAFRDWCKTSEPENADASYNNPYYYRWLAATSTLNLDDESDRFKLGRAFYHLAQRRGFKSNRLDSTPERDDGVVKTDIRELSEKMAGRTLGQYFWEDCYQNGLPIRKVHTSRDEHYLAEFNLICEKQGLSDELKKRLHRAIFFQRPLKSQKGLVANCPFEPKKKRAPVSHPLFEEFRMWQTLNNIKIKTLDDDQLRPLTADEKEILIPKFLRDKNHFDFKDIAKTLTPRNQKHAYHKSRDASEAHVLFNYRDNQSISACPISAKLKNRVGDDDFKTALFTSYCGDKKEQKTPEDILHEVWHVLFSFDDAEKVKQYAQEKLGMDAESAEKFSKINPPQGYGALSLKAIRKILPFLEQGLLYSHAVFFANLDQVIGVSEADSEQVKDDISKLIDEHNQYVAEARCVNEFVREYKDDPRAFEENYDLRNIQGFSEKLPSELQESAERVCRTVRFQTLENNGNGEYMALKRLDERVGDYLKEAFGVEDAVLKKLYHPSAIEAYKPAEKHSDGKYYLGDPRISSIRNPVFMRAMHRVKAVVNELLKQGVITDQTRVHLEMARELNDANKRAAIRSWQRNNEKKRQDYKSKIEEILKARGIERGASEDEILKYQLWEEQNHICPYTGVTINTTDFIGENPRFDIEHTIPRSLSCDNSQENMTLCERDYNRNVKKKKIPYECPDYSEILKRISHWQDEVERLIKEIEKQRPRSRYAATKDLKDSAIQKRLVLEFERDYLRGKVRRFTIAEVTGGFKNSQLVDTRIITKYARMYLKTVFSEVHTVNGKTTDDFRRCWGIEKSRDNHAHHTVDAIVAACVTREQYDRLARYYHDYESYDQNDPSVPEKPHFSKPWKTFTEDMKDLKNQLFVSHYAPNNLLKQAKKYAKVRGKMVVQQGQTARGSLHQDTFYGAIKRFEENKRSGEVEEITRYVVRKQLSELSESDLKKIVDERVRKIAIAGRPQEGHIRKQIDKLKIKKLTSDDTTENELQNEINELERQLSGLYVLPNKHGAPVPIKKVRVYSNLTNPIELKKQRDKSAKTQNSHKENYYVNNDSNYVLEIFDGEKRREFELYKNIDAANGRVPESRQDAVSLRKGLHVLLYKDNPSEVWECSPEEIVRRFYVVQGLSSMTLQKKYRYGIVVLMHSLEARQFTDLKVQDGDFKPKEPYIPLRKFLHTRFKALVEGRDFALTSLGELRRV